MNHYCCVPHCSSWAKKNPEISFHTFPKAGKVSVIFETKLDNKELMDRRKVWIKNLRIGKPVSEHMREKFHEILKLDITLRDEKLQKEFKACRNFLQRHRSLNATFRTLIQFSKFIEARRLINTIVLSKEDKISLTCNEDGSLQIEYFSNLSGILIRVSWKVEWSIKDCEFKDVIEVYYNNFELPTTDSIKEKLTALTHHSLDFQSKLRLWTFLMSDLNTSEEHVKKRKMGETNPGLSEAETVLVISDGEEDMQNAGNRKKRRVTPQSCDTPVILVPD